jgi:AcrR family transcriptional regulator
MTGTPAQPVTEVQRARYRRIVDVAAMLVTTGGEDALQMSEMPSLAEVSLATLYRYFPSKEHLLFAVVQQHLESALAKAQILTMCRLMSQPTARLPPRPSDDPRRQGGGLGRHAFSGSKSSWPARTCSRTTVLRPCPGVEDRLTPERRS